MREMMKVMAVVAIMAVPSLAATLYEQEGTSADGDAPINATGQYTGSGDGSLANWKWQYGSGSWSGIYAGSNGWLEASSSGDSAIDVEADIEMYYEESIADNKIYFHIGNLKTATTAELTAIVSGSFWCNNGQYMGISFPGGTKSLADFEKVGTAFTGKIIGGMQSDNDTWRAQNNAMDISFLMQWNGGSGWSGWQAPVNYGDGAHSTVHDTLWWLVNGGQPGSYAFQWQVRLLPTQFQPDGDYYLDPRITYVTN